MINKPVESSWQETITLRKFKIILIDKSQIMSLVRPFYKDQTAHIACVDIPGDSLLTDIIYSMEEDGFLIKAYHPTFMPVPVGEFAPRVQTSLQYVQFHKE